MHYRGSRGGRDLHRITLSTKHNTEEAINTNDKQLLPNGPSLFVLNPTSLAKDNALDQLAVDLQSYDSDIAVISESWFKSHHSTQFSNIPHYITYSKDRKKRRGGGVALFVTDRNQSKECNLVTIDDRFELIWIETRVFDRTVIIVALFHPPKTTYLPSNLMLHFETVLDELRNTYETTPSYSPETSINSRNRTFSI